MRAVAAPETILRADGTYHSFSRKHLGQYLKEREFAWNTRFMTDAERAAEGMRRADGKRLTYEVHGRRA